mgnify:CR=1 FL=1
MSKHRRTVTALIDSKRGVGERVVPAGTVGQLYATCILNNTCLVYWPTIERAYKGDNRMSSHRASDLRFN